FWSRFLYFKTFPESISPKIAGSTLTCNPSGLRGHRSGAGIGVRAVDEKLREHAVMRTFCRERASSRDDFRTIAGTIHRESVRIFAAAMAVAHRGPRRVARAQRYSEAKECGKGSCYWEHF